MYLLEEEDDGVYGEGDAWDIMAPEMRESIRRNPVVFQVYMDSKFGNESRRHRILEDKFRVIVRNMNSLRTAAKRRVRKGTPKRFKWKIQSSEDYQTSPRVRRYDVSYMPGHGRGKEYGQRK